MIRFFFTSLAAAAALLVPTLGFADEVFPVVHSEPITIRVLSGRDGLPQARVHVLLVGGYDRRDLGVGEWHEEGVTDASGSLQLPNGLRNLPLLRVTVLKGHACAPGSGDAAFSVELIRRDGVSGANRCGVEAADSAPGVLTFYVKGGKVAKSAVEGAGRPAKSREEANKESDPKLHASPAAATVMKASPLVDAAQSASARAATAIVEMAPLTDAEIDQLAAEQP